MDQLEQILQTRLSSYPLIWKPGIWKQNEQQGIVLALQTTFPDETLCQWIKQAVPTCQADYLFSRGYEPVSADNISLTHVRD